jgi:hypothetical protein
MAYYSRSTRRLAKQSKRKLIWTIIILLGLGYASIFWILPTFIGGIGILNGVLHPSKGETPVSENPTLAPPQISIPFEATNSATMDIKGYSTGKKVQIFLDDQLKQTADVDSSGNFNASDIDLSLGTNNIYGKSLDEKNQESLPSKTFKVIYDDTNPTLEINNPPDGAEIQGERKLNITGKTDSDAYVFINNAQAIVQQDGNFSYQISLGDGENNINIKSQDQALNITEINRKVIFKP